MSVDMVLAKNPAIGDIVVGSIIIGGESFVLSDGRQGRRFELFIRSRRSRSEPVGITVRYSGSAHDAV
jgi:hypothetical protein